MHAFDVLGDPVRRRILELLGGGGVVLRRDHRGRPAGVRDLAAGRLAAPEGAARERFRDRPPEGARRLYAVDSAPLQQVDAWLDPFRRFWDAASRFTRDRARSWQA